MKRFLIHHVGPFSRSQVTAGLATASDFAILALFAEVLGFHYMTGVVVGALTGAIVNFLANRNWAFGSDGHLHQEAVRYFLVSIMSLGWNCIFVWILTDIVGIMYLFSKVIVSLFVGFFWNYPLHRYWVFTRSSS